MVNKVRIVEVGPRDGLQNVKDIIPTSLKIEFIKKLSQCGYETIEATSFVSPKWVPQMADAKEILSALNLNSNISYPVLVPNLKGLDLAIESGVKEIAVFGSASEAFSQKNINCSIDDSLIRFKNVINKAIDHNIKVRGYVSCVLGCPYQGNVKKDDIIKLSKALIDYGCYEVSLGDTIGVGTPLKTKEMILSLTNKLPVSKLAVHFHDTRGQALANLYVALELGISVVDTSIAGLGGCPYAKGASGNVATEDVVYMLHGMGIQTGLNLEKIIEVGKFFIAKTNLQNNSKVSIAFK